MKLSTILKRFDYSLPASEPDVDCTGSRESHPFKMHAISGENAKLKADEFIFIRDSSIVRRLKLDDILYVEAMGDYVKLYIPAKFYVIHTTLKIVEERLPASRFLRVHRSYLVALDKIDTVEGGALIINGKSLPVADTHRSALNKRMNVL